MSFPNFIIAGFPKCGTTSLHHYLSEHPQIYMPKQKELHFFTHKILSKQLGGKGDKITKQMHVNSLDNYKNFFPDSNKYKAIGEASPSYINYPEVYNEIKTQLSSPKIIVLVRDPINRAYSNYLHLKRESRELLSFQDALDNEQTRKKLKYSDFWYYKFNSLYYEKIKHLKSVFDNVLVLTQEELMLSPALTIKKAYSFLNVENSFVPKIINKKYNPGGNYTNNIITRAIFKPSKTKNILKKIISIKPWMKDGLNWITRHYKNPTEPIEKETLAKLKNYFRKDVELIESIGVDVSSWRNYK